MKNRLLILLCFVFGLMACFDDESSFGTLEVGEIEIKGLPEKESIISYNGNVLRVSPDVKAGYPESEMKYAWYIYGGSFEQKSDYRAYPIGEAKDLAYEVNLPSGAYTVVFEVTAPNSYTQTATFSLKTSTEFSEGFYILKETADGNTELDLLADNGHLSSNLMQKVLEAPLAGKPLGLAVTYDNGYIDETDQEMKSTNMVHVFAEQDYRAFRTEDMYQTFSRENRKFESVPADETFCAATYDPMNGIIFLSNQGLYLQLSQGLSSGKLGVPYAEGGSKFIQSFGLGFNGTVFWNEETHSLCEIEEGDLAEEDIFGEAYYRLPAGIRAEDLECLASGLNYSLFEEVGWFLCQDRNSGKRLLFQVTSFGMLDVQVRTIAADAHLATGSVFAGNGLDAAVIYVADNNVLYLYDLETEEETLFSPQGLEGEITYISNNYLNMPGGYDDDLNPVPSDESFNYLVVATRTGNGYKLYFYDNLVGGIPTGKAKQTIEGTGTVKGVRYLSTTPLEWPFGFDAPVYPYGD